MKTNAFLLLLGLAAVQAACQKKSTEEETTTTEETVQYTPGTTLSGNRNYTRFIVGDTACPIILSAGHGGSLKPSYIPDRTQGETKADVYTIELTGQIADTLEKITGLRPYIIINNLHRIKLDPNRELDEAYLTHEDTRSAWREYHDFIDKAEELVTQYQGKGLYLDMHGHAHDIDRIEVGYLIKKADLNTTDTELDLLSDQASIYAIAQTSSLPFSELVRGEKAFGTLLGNAGYRAVPSEQDPAPGDDPYFNGGYSTLAHGSRDGGTISSMQLETPGPDVRNNSSLRQKAGGAIAHVIVAYYKTHYGVDLEK